MYLHFIESFCPPGFTYHKKRCYQLSSHYGSADEARQRCQTLHKDPLRVRSDLYYDLASIRSIYENKFLTDLMILTDGGLTLWDDYPWIGLFQIGTMAWTNPKWTDGTYARYVKWGYREPSDYQVLYSTLILGTHGQTNIIIRILININYVQYHIFL